MTTDFAVFMRRFLISHLTGLRGCSPNAVASCRNTFKLLIADTWFRTKGRSRRQAHLNHIDVGAVTAFLGHLQDSRHNGLTTRNQRLAAISSFCTWMQTQNPARMACSLAGHPRHPLAEGPSGRQPPDRQAGPPPARPARPVTRQGRRDAILLATLYDTGARVQELATSPSATSASRTRPWPR